MSATILDIVRRPDLGERIELIASAGGRTFRDCIDSWKEFRPLTMGATENEECENLIHIRYVQEHQLLGPPSYRIVDTDGEVTITTFYGSFEASKYILKGALRIEA